MRALKLIDELQRRPMARELADQLAAIKSAVESESAKEQNINARLQAQVQNLNWRLRQGEVANP